MIIICNLALKLLLTLEVRVLLTTKDVARKDGKSYQSCLEAFKINVIYCHFLFPSSHQSSFSIYCFYIQFTSFTNQVFICRNSGRIRLSRHLSKTLEHIFRTDEYRSDLSLMAELDKLLVVELIHLVFQIEAHFFSS